MTSPRFREERQVIRSLRIHLSLTWTRCGPLGEGDAFDGKQLLGVDGLVGSDEIGAQLFEFLGILDADDAEAGGGEAVLQGVPGRTSLTRLTTGSRGPGGISAVGSELFFRDRPLGRDFESFERFGHQIILSPNV